MTGAPTDQRCGSNPGGGYDGLAFLLLSKVYSFQATQFSHRCPALPLLHRCLLQVTAGSGDRFVYIWNVASRALMYKLPGHSGSVNECVFHPGVEPIIGSASSDKTIYLGELAQ